MSAEHLATCRAAITCFIAVVLRWGMCDYDVSIEGNLAPELLSFFPCVAKCPTAMGWRIGRSKNLEMGLWSIGASQANLDRLMSQEFDGGIILEQCCARLRILRALIMKMLTVIGIEWLIESDVMIASLSVSIRLKRNT